MIYLGADHGGFKLKEKIKEKLDKDGLKWEDKGNKIYDEQDNYPIFAAKVAEAVAKNPKKHLGILFCRTGAGVTVVANKYPGILAALGINSNQIIKIRKDENFNVLTIASDYTSIKNLKKMIESFTRTKFSGEKRHIYRLKVLKKIERNNFK